MGYSTLYGDMVGGFAPLKDVFKTRVYDLARWRNAQGAAPVIPEAILEKAPSAELKPGQVDQDSLPPYPELDGVLAGYVERDESRRRDRGGGLRPCGGRPGDPTHRHRRVQAPSGPARRQDHVEGLRQGPADARHQRVRRLKPVDDGFSIELVTHDWGRFEEVLDLCYDVLYRSFGVARQGDWYHPAHGSEFAVALDAGDAARDSTAPSRAGRRCSAGATGSCSPRLALGRESGVRS